MSISRAAPFTVPIILIDSTNRPARKTGAASIVTQISKDGGAFASTTNSATELTTSSGSRYALSLTALEMAAAVVHIIASATGCDPVDMIYHPVGLADGVVTGSGSTTTSITATGQAETATDHWKGSFLRFTTGALAGQVRQITGYATGAFTCVAFTSAPTAGDRYVIVNG